MTLLPALAITPTTAPRGGNGTPLNGMPLSSMPLSGMPLNNNNRNNASHPRAGE